MRKMIICLEFECSFLKIWNIELFLNFVPHEGSPAIKQIHIVYDLSIKKELFRTAFFSYLHAFIRILFCKARLSAVYLTYGKKIMVAEGISDIRMLVIDIFQTLAHDECLSIIFAVNGCCSIKYVEAHKIFWIDIDLCRNKPVIYDIKVEHCLTFRNGLYHIVDFNKVFVEIAYIRLKGLYYIDICARILNVPVEHIVKVFYFTNKLSPDRWIIWRYSICFIIVC